MTTIVVPPTRAYAFHKWQSGSGGDSLKPLIDLTDNLPYYLTSDDKLSCTIRARLRFNRSNKNTSLYKINMSTHTWCPYCPLVDETLDHIIHTCPIYDLPTMPLRTNLIHSLNQYPINKRYSPWTCRTLQQTD